MRFDRLFEDLEAQLETQLDADGARRRGDEERLRIARLSVRDRMAALTRAGGDGIRLRMVDGSSVELTLETIGRDWLAAAMPSGGQCVMPLGAVAALSLDAAQVAASIRPAPEPEPAGGGLAARIGIGVVLRDLARRRVAVDVHTAGEPVAVHGTIDRVGSDHFDLAVHERGVPRRGASVIEHRVVPVHGLTCVVLE